MAVVAAGYLSVVDPNQPGRYPSCPILFLTGHWCPGCGGLRAVHALMHGDVVTAVSANLVVVLMVPVAVLLWGRWAALRSGVRSVEGRQSWSVSPLLWCLALAGVLLFWVLRNLPATAWLAP